MSIPQAPERSIDIDVATRPVEVGADPASMQAALQQLHDEKAIRDLAALYAVVRDDNDIDGLMACYAEDGMFVHNGTPITGRAALREYYLGNMRRNSFSLHVPQSVVVTFQSPTEATGLVTGHGEFAHPDVFTVCAYRYHDRYRKIDGRWMFSYRDHDFLYAVPVEQLPGLGREDLRVRWPHVDPVKADWNPRSLRHDQLAIIYSDSVLVDEGGPAGK